MQPWHGPLLLLGAISGCAALSRAPEAAPLAFVLVRHAEKAPQPAGDPPLSAAGMQRARSLASRLRKDPVAAVYATGYLRTQYTAQPTADGHGLPLRLYDAALAAPDMARQLRQLHASGTVLVVGHSNTIPALASALCACPVAPIHENEYGRRMTITFDHAARPTLVVVSDP